MQKRFDIYLTDELAEDIKTIEEQTGLSRGEIFLRAITLYKRAKQQQLDGGNFLLRESSGGLLELVGF
jgi:hypothetical protein